MVMAGFTSARSARKPAPAAFRGFVKRRWPIVASWLLFFSAVPAALGAIQTARYCTESLVLLADSEVKIALEGESNVLGATRDVANEINNAYSDPVSQRVAGRLGYVPQVEISGGQSSDVLSFVGCEATAETAADSANTWAEVYVEQRQDEEAASIASAIEGVEARLEVLQARRLEIREPLTALEARIAATNDPQIRNRLLIEASLLGSDLTLELQLIDLQIQTAAATASRLDLGSRLAQDGTAQVIRVAPVPEKASSSPVQRYAIAGAFLGLLLGLAAAAVVENLDRSIKTAEDIRRINVLGSIPRPRRRTATSSLPLATVSATDGAVAEAYHQLRTTVDVALSGRRIKSILVTSAEHNDGKTTTACNLAFTLSAIDHRVVLADIDFRKPGIHEVFRRPSEPGLSNHILHDTPLSKLAHLADVGHRNMVVIPVGIQPPDPADFVASPAFGELIQSLEREADLVILDASPVAHYPDAYSVANQVDAVIVVAKAGSTSQAQLDAAVDGLVAVGAEVLGVCLVGVKAKGRSRNVPSTKKPEELDDPLLSGLETKRDLSLSK